MADTEETIPKDNPASRLYTILSKIIHYTDSQLSIRKTWSQILNINYPRELLLCFKQLYELNDEIKRMLEAFDIPDPKHYLCPLKQFDELLDHCVLNIDTPFKNIPKKYQVSESLLRELKYCEHMLDNHISETLIKEEELNKLKQEVETLIDQVTSGLLEDDFKEFLVKQLNEIRTAICEYGTLGNKALHEALKSNIGAIVLNIGLLKRNKDKKEFESFWKIISVLQSLYITATKLKEIGETFSWIKQLPNLFGL